MKRFLPLLFLSPINDFVITSKKAAYIQMNKNEGEAFYAI